MTHTPSEAGSRTAMASTGESAPSTEQSAHPGIALAFPKLCRDRPAIVEPLELLNQAALQESLGDRPALASDRLLAYAQIAFSELQALLADHEDSQLQGAFRREIWDAQGVVRLALPGRGGELKRLQLEAGAGRPLTVCFGHRARQVPLPYDDVIYPEGDGCGLVHPDSTGLRRPTFSSYCRKCRASTTELAAQSLRQARATKERRFRFLVFDEHGTPIPVWVGPCTSCEGEFVTNKPHIRRCELHRRHHRGPAA